MATAQNETALPEPLPSSRSSSSGSRFSNLRGVRWRIDLGVLPNSPDSIDDLRRVAADSRRKYVRLKRRLLVNSHPSKDENRSSGVIMDDPLSQSPDSKWGRFFRNAELEKMLDQDLSRLYPEHGSYFQTAACQLMLRQILLLWCLKHPEYGYRKGMHELLAPLLYVLHVDLQHLSQVQELYADHFNDEFDETSFFECDMVSDYGFKKTTNMNTGSDSESCFYGGAAKVSCLDKLDPDTRELLLMNDAYGAEGELGVILSEKFMEHDAYCMFDAVMSGAHGVVAMADFFSTPPAMGSGTELPPVVEASSTFYQLLRIVDSSLHNHLVELGVEPQYFALRWLRVLFGREFSLKDLLAVWDEIFSSPNHVCPSDIANDADFNLSLLCSPRGAFISAMAVSMLLHLRSTLLATEHATTCLQRLLNFPKDISVKKLIEKAKSLHTLAFETNLSSSSPRGGTVRNKRAVRRAHSLSLDSASPRTSPSSLPESYWEEKWRVLHRAEESHKTNGVSTLSKIRNGSLKEKLGLFRVELDASTVKNESQKKDAQSSIQHKIFDNAFQEGDTKVNLGEIGYNENPDISGIKESFYMNAEVGKDSTGEQTDQNFIGRSSDVDEEACSSIKQSSVLFMATGSLQTASEHEYDSEKSIVTSNSFVSDNDCETGRVEELCSSNCNKKLLQDSEATSVTGANLGQRTSRTEKHAAVLKEQRPLSGKFQWFWKFGRVSGEGNLDDGKCVKQQKFSGAGGTCKDISEPLTCHGCSNSCRVSRKLEVEDKEVLGTLRSFGQSMHENIQVIESAFQQEQGQVGFVDNSSSIILGAQGQLTITTALKELRKIGDLLLEM
ncbi:uncharacterized protein [Elaeis guineensis]|uniref:uncharacterized protein n=1 Tax=Elaeis guineensis var. tenera TaxID=51953 RepID=UPI003C6D8619